MCEVICVLSSISQQLDCRDFNLFLLVFFNLGITFCLICRWVKMINHFGTDRGEVLWNKTIWRRVSTIESYYFGKTACRIPGVGDYGQSLIIGKDAAHLPPPNTGTGNYRGASVTLHAWFSMHALARMY